MLCTSCGLPTPTNDVSSPKAKAAGADRRREQNRRAQQRFRLERNRERKALPQQDGSHPQNGTSAVLDDVSQVASSVLTPITPPSTLCTNRRHPSIGRYEESQGVDMIDYDFSLDPTDHGEINQCPHDFWTSTPKETAPFAAPAFVHLSEPKDKQGNYTVASMGDSVDDGESRKVPSGPNNLHRAVQSGNAKVVRLLLEHNADCNSKDHDGLTPLMCAVTGDHEEVLELLLSHGACIGHVDKTNWSALHWAVFHNHYRILEKLLSCCGGDTALLNVQSNDGETALSVAVGVGSEVAVKLLLESGATVNNA
ncbi:hypothetical protein N7476_004938 [Penicillium atrosanguineum]|uniref:BZIP domain-containing protein n=1 Tax=Penicillium atrosanguineum TaxID=1132637 RepID=A0A9W9PYE1_9EURO|nr:hypothetical protein N7476_004938 [Penicillium atrosanguineum]